MILEAQGDIAVGVYHGQFDQFIQPYITKCANKFHKLFFDGSFLGQARGVLKMILKLKSKPEKRALRMSEIGFGCEAWVKMR